MEAAQAVQLTGTNRSNAPDRQTARVQRQNPPHRRPQQRRFALAAHHTPTPTPTPGRPGSGSGPSRVWVVRGPGPLGLGPPGGHSEGQSTRSHPELGRENPLRRWYCASRRGRVGRRQAPQSPDPIPQAQSPGPIPGPNSLGPIPKLSPNPAAAPRPPYPGPPPGPRRLASTPAGWSSPVARQAHNLKVVGSNPTPATKSPLRHQSADAPRPNPRKRRHRHRPTSI